MHLHGKEAFMRNYMSALFGNKTARENLGAAIERNALPHALIIEGAIGSGKKTLARQIIAASLCESALDPRASLPCGNCRACRLIAEDKAVDVSWVTRGEKSTLGVDTVREAKQDMFLSSTEFAYKFYVFCDAHTMTVQAQNALLIVLEEPPPCVKIILLCESADALLTTVRSRARLIRMERFTSAQIKEWLCETHPREINRYENRSDVLDAILLEADGCIGKSLSFFESKNEESLFKERQTTESLLSAMASHSFTDLCRAFRALPSKREELILSLTFFLRALRDLVLVKKSSDFSPCFFLSVQSASERAQAFRLNTLLRAMEDTENAIRSLERNAGSSTVLNLLKCSLRG